MKRRTWLLKRLYGGVSSQKPSIVAYSLSITLSEFTLYGACRWGHVSNQFDNPFFAIVP